MRGLSKVIGALALLAVLASCQPLSGLGANGLDVSGWQHPNGATIDWAPVRASGRSFAFVKATEGLSYTNPYFGVDWAGLQANGMLRGAYHYGRPELDPARQADFFVSVIGGLTRGDLPPVLDLESSGNLGADALVGWVATFLSRVQALTGRRPLIYTYPNFWKNATGDSRAFAGQLLWIADYNGGSAPTLPLPGGWRDWAFWQHTSSGSLPGIVGSVDLDVFCCDDASLILLSDQAPVWLLRNSLSPGVADLRLAYGDRGDVPLSCDWAGTGIDTPGVFRNGRWYIRLSNTTGRGDVSVGFGDPGDIPVCGDWDGNGTDTPGVYRRGVFYLRNSLTTGVAHVAVPFGNPGDVPVAGRWKPGGPATIGVYRPGNITFYLRNHNTVGVPDEIEPFGNLGDQPLAGDWNGDGVDTVGVFRPPSATFYLRTSHTPQSGTITMPYGTRGDAPLVGDWTGQGHDAIGVVR